MIYLVFDAETTGLPKHPSAKPETQPRIIEFGGVLIDSDLVVLGELHMVINPGIPLEPIITKITGLTDDDLKGEKTFAEVAEEIKTFFGKADAIVAHNLPFDMTMIELEIERNGIENWAWPEIKICTVQEHSEEWGRFPKLLELYEHYMCLSLDQSHRALDDVYSLIEVAKAAGVFI